MNSSGAPWKRDDCVCVCVCVHMCACVSVCVCACMHMWCAYYEKGIGNVLIIQGITAVSVLQAHMTCSLIIREQELCFS